MFPVSLQDLVRSFNEREDRKVALVALMVMGAAMSKNAAVINLSLIALFMGYKQIGHLVSFITYKREMAKPEVREAEGEEELGFGGFIEAIVGWAAWLIEIVVIFSCITIAILL